MREHWNFADFVGGHFENCGHSLAIFSVRIFYLPALIYMPSFVEISLAVSDKSKVNDFDIRSRFPWQRLLFWKFQNLRAPLYMGIHLPVKFSKYRIVSLWEFGRKSSREKKRKNNNNKKRSKNNKSPNEVWRLNNNNNINNNN